DLAALSPFTVVLALGFGFHYVIGRRRDADDLIDFIGLYALFTLALHTVLSFQTGGYAVGVRQLLLLVFAGSFLAACALLTLSSGALGRVSPWILVAGCAAVTAQSTVTFHRAFVANQLYDPNTPAILGALGFLPTGPEDSFAC